MKRTLVLRPETQVGLGYNAGSVDPGSSPYPGTNVPSQDLAAAWADDSLDTYWYGWPGAYTGAVGYVSFPKGPTQARITKLTFETAWDYSQQGPNNWYFPPDNAYGPAASITLLGRDGVTAHQGGYYFAPDPDVDLNCNINTESPHPHVQTWELTSHPEGGNFTMDDVNRMQAGVTLIWSNGPSGKPFDAVPRFEKTRVFYLKATIEYEDLGAVVSNVRHCASLTLRLMRRARNAVTIKGLAEHFVGGIGSEINLSHPEGPSVPAMGWGSRRLERRPGIVLKRTIFPETFEIEDEVFDRHAYACLVWAAYRLAGPWSPELQGLAFLDKGLGFTHERDQDAWSPRPGDGVLMRVLAANPNLSYHGLAAQGGGDVVICLRNYDLMQLAWSTVGSSGEFTPSSSTSVYMVEEQGYLTSALFTYGPLGGQGGRERSLGLLPYADGDFVHVRAVVKNTSVPDPDTDFLELVFLRSGGGLPATEYWDEAGRAWTTTPTYNPIPSEDAFGELVCDAVPMDAPAAASDPSYFVRVGRFSSNVVSAQFHAALVDVQKGGAGNGDCYGARTPTVTLDDEITREPDIHKIVNSALASREIWSYTRGVAMVEARPFWRAEVLPADDVRPMLHAYHDTDTYDALQFVAKTGSDDLVRFERAVSGQATFQLDCPIPSLDLNRTHVLRAWARWLGSDGWTEYAAYSVEVGYAVFLEATGELVSSGSVVGALSYTGDVAARAWVGVGTDGTLNFDGYVRVLEVRRNPISGLEAIWKL